MDVMQLPYLGKPVEKGFRQAFSSSSLVQWILAGKQSGLTLLNSESHSQFGDVNLAQITNSQNWDVYSRLWKAFTQTGPSLNEMY